MSLSSIDLTAVTPDTSDELLNECLALFLTPEDCHCRFKNVMLHARPNLSFRKSGVTRKTNR